MTVLSATDASLRAFEARPTRAEAMADLAHHFHDLGMRETASLFARRGLASIPDGDLLFIESVRPGLTSILSIDGYYCVDPAIRREAALACDALALDRDAAPEVRALARRNLHFYLRHISQEFPSWNARRIAFPPPDHYNQMAPSVCLHEGRLLAALRTVNYAIDYRGYYRIADDLPITEGSEIHTRTFLVEFDPETLADSPRGEITTPLRPIPGACKVYGFEDMRLFSWRGDLWGLSTVLDQNTDGRAEQWLGLVPSGLVMADLRPINPLPISPRDKNWMPVVDGDAPLRFIYWTDPGRIIGIDGETVATNVPPIAADHLRGSSATIPFEGGWLAVVHWVEWFDRWPKYRHRFAWYDADLTLRKVSPGWVFSDKKPNVDLLEGYEYVTGLAPHPDGQRLVIGYQIHEREAWIGTIDIDDVTRTLGLSSSHHHLGLQSNALQSATVQATTSHSPAAIEQDTPNETVTPRELPELLDGSWALKQTNQALQSMDDVDRAARNLERAGLPLHPSRPKCWDSYLATWHCHETCTPDDRVLDAGGLRSSVFLPGLVRLGHTRLLSINIEENDPGTDSGVAYHKGDITHTSLESSAFKFIACLSVLEHGVDWRAFFDEAARLLSPNGHLFISVDYWETPVSTAHVVFLGAWAGQTWRIFTHDDVIDMIVYARNVGLDTTGPIDFQCGDRAVSHLGCNFTFLNMMFCRR